MKGTCFECQIPLIPEISIMEKKRGFITIDKLLQTYSLIFINLKLN